MKKILLSPLLFLFALNIYSQENNTERNLEVFQKKFESGVDFIARGTEPFWGLDLDFKNSAVWILADDMKEVVFNNPKKIRNKSKDTLRFVAKNSKEKIKIEITRKACSDNMSDLVYTHSVKVTIGEKVYNGCGYYLYDTRLHDIWVLQNFKGKEIDKNIFAGELPRIEPKPLEEKFVGFAGCNNMFGNVFFKGNSISFNSIASTKMYCELTNKFEQEFLSMLQKKMKYKIENNKLTFSRKGKPVMVFKKID
ncbi:MAG: hypothetical protein C0425_11745 [Chlorobiaceae bacterium]|nr:hypothetical protein [Chlorobiaceae bacterium]MBA4310987.1 hypothetical protein [Chlorobiaceae bacterium]